MSLEKQIVQTLEPIVEEIVELKKKVGDIQVIKGEKGDAGAPGIGIKAVAQSEDLKHLDLEFDSGDVVTVQLPPGPQGPQGPASVAVDCTLKMWSAGVCRSDTYVQHNLGQVFKALVDTATEPGTSADWERVGSFGFRHCGAFDESREYVDGDMYVKNYGLFMVLNGQAFCAAGRGEKGATGPRGESGLPGKAGADGADVVAVEARGLSLAVVTRDAAGKLNSFVADFEPVIKAHIESIRTDLMLSVQDEVKSLMDVSLAHPTDPDATPLRFYRGVWHSDINFQAGDVVTYAEQLYVAVQDSMAQMPGGNASLLDPFPIDNYWRRLITGGGGGGGGESLQAGLLAAMQDQINAIQVGLLNQVAVIDFLTAPPPNPKEGDRYIVALGAFSTFNGRENQVAFYGPNGWEFKIPEVGNAHYVNATQKSVVWNGQNWVFLPRQAKVSLQADPPLDPNLGDTWLDNSGSKLEVRYWDGVSWITSSGTRTFTQNTDPQLAGTIKDGDVWVQTFDADPVTGVAPVPVTWVFSGGSWSQTTPSIPASSRTYMQSETPTAGARGDTWIDLASGKPLVKYYDGISWIDSGGTRTFSQNTDPTKDTPPKVVNEGDLWNDATDLNNIKIYQWTSGKWVQVNTGGGSFVPEAPPALTRGIWSRFIQQADPATHHEAVFTTSATLCKFDVQKKPAFCPVPSKYLTSSNWFKITIWYDTTRQESDVINAQSQFSFANGSWYTTKRGIPKFAQYDRFTDTGSYFCKGNTESMSWMTASILAGSNVPNSTGSLNISMENVLVTWELLTL